MQCERGRDEVTSEHEEGTPNSGWDVGRSWEGIPKPVMLQYTVFELRFSLMFLYVWYFEAVGSRWLIQCHLTVFSLFYIHTDTHTQALSYTNFSS